MGEIAVQKKIKTNLEKKGWYVIRLTVTGVGGMPDLLALKKGEDPLFIEVKKEKGGVVSKLQMYMIKKLKSFGFKAVVANSWEVIDKQLK